MEREERGHTKRGDNRLVGIRIMGMTGDEFKESHDSKGTTK